MNGMKRLAVILLALILGAVCAYGIEQALYTAATGNVATDTAGATIYGPSVQRVMQSDCTLVDGAYTITGDEPWFGLSNGNYKTSNIKIQLKTPAESGFYYKIYFAGADLEFSESNTVQGNAAPGTQTLTLEIPQGVYASLRFYFDTDLQIESIESGGETFAPNWLRAALVCVGIALLFSLLVFLIQKKRQPKTLLRALAIALALAVLLDLGIYLFSGRSLVYRQEDVVDTLDPMDGTLYQCKVIDGYYTPTDKIAQLWVYLDAYEIQGLTFQFSTPTRTPAEVQAYYMSSESGLNISHHVDFGIGWGVKEAGVNLPAGEYTALLFNFKQAIPLESIRISADPVEISYKNYAVTPQTAVLMASFALFVLLVYGLKPVQSGLSALYRMLLHPKTRFRAVDILYAAAAAFMVLFHIYITLWFPEVSTGTEILHTAWCVMAVAGILLGKMWRDKGFWVLAAFWLLKFFRLFIPHPELVVGAKDTFYSGIFAFFVCYAVGRALRPDMHKVFLKIICSVWTLAMTVLCVMGIYAAWTGTLIYNYSTAYIGISPTVGHPGYQRMTLVYYATTTAGIVASSVAVSLMGAMLFKQRWLKILFAVSIVPMVIACGLTSTRTTYITIGFALSLFVIVLLYNHMIAKKTEGRLQKLAAKEVLILAAAFVLLFGGLVVSQVFIADGFNAIKSKGGVILPHALAESEATFELDVAHRGFISGSLNSLLSGRVTIWQAAVQNITSSAEKLMLGESVLHPMKNVNAIISSRAAFEHCHNIFLQTMLENGIPGLIILVAFLVIFVVNAWKLVFCRTMPMWKRLLPFPAIVVLIGELAECLTILQNDFPPMTFFYLFAGFTIAVGETISKEKQIKA